MLKSSEQPGVFISNIQSQVARAHIIGARPLSFIRRLRKRFLRTAHIRRRAVRYSLLALNLAILTVAIIAISHGNSGGQALASSAVSQEIAPSNAPTNPLDQLSSADIAQSVASLTNLPEATAVRNQAQTVSAELAVTPAQDSVITKPQVVTTALKSREDIQNYATQTGDTVSSVAAKFNVTSNSIKWSNNLTSDSLHAGTSLVIPPINGIVYTVKAGDTPSTLATKYSVGSDQIIAFNDAEIGGIQPGEQILIPNGQPPAAPVYSFFATYSSGGGASNGYDFGFCTWYVATQVSVPTNWGNASSWSYYAALSGWTVSSTPVVGAIAQTPYAAGGLGHVAVVDAVSPDGTQIQYRDMNGLAGWDRVGYSGWVSASTYPHYIYH